MSTASISSPTRLPCDSSHPHPHPHPHQHTHQHSHSPGRLPRHPSSRAPAGVHPLLTPGHRSPSFLQDARTSSPNYFGLKVDSAKDCESGGPGRHARTNWSPPSSKVRSAAAISPKVIPLDQDPEFEAFRRQSELHGFNPERLAGFNVSVVGQERGSSRASREEDTSPVSPSSKTTAASPRPSGEHGTLEPKPKSPKRMLSSPGLDAADRPRRNSPAEFNERDARNAPKGLQRLRGGDEIRYSLPLTDKDPLPAPLPHHRSDTLPAILNGQCSGDSDDIRFTSPAEAVAMLNDSTQNTLLLDLRVSTQYARSRISGALNLCIPTTLLKRPSYTPQKLAETFKVDEQRHQFERWRSCNNVIVYDGNACKAKDALACINMLKKFVNEGFSGTSCIIRGGFAEFSKQYPSLVVHDSDDSDHLPQNSDARRPSLPPVIGGCPMPSSNSAANPFFGNIRQNMDLIGGVGQIPIKRPSSLSIQQVDDLPLWLRRAVDENDKGKLVSDKFLEIERSEQKRMQAALSGKGAKATPRKDAPNSVQVAGLELGDKNRYHNIWPYEHSRVKLQGIREGGCDYFNANYVKSAWSKKRYIATQGPIPATFTDFWDVVWQQDVRVIVMLTAEKEGGQIRAHNYWENTHYGPLRLNFLSQHRASLEPSKIHRHRERPAPGRRRCTNPPLGQRAHPSLETSNSSTGPSDNQQAYVIVRRFTLSNDNEPFARMREITQLQYPSWPDFGAPAYPAHVLGLVEQCDSVVRASQTGAENESSRPVLVHCSAGCGRTGTFCTIDSVIDMLKRQRQKRESDRIAASVREATPMEVDRAGEKESPSSIPQADGALRAPVFKAPTSGPGANLASQPSLFVNSVNSVNPSSFFGPAAASPTSPAISTPVSARPGSDRSWLIRDDIDLIEKTVEDFRLQRLSMVQSLRQFVLCYESVLEWMAVQTPKSA